MAYRKSYRRYKRRSRYRVDYRKLVFVIGIVVIAVGLIIGGILLFKGKGGTPGPQGSGNPQPGQSGQPGQSQEPGLSADLDIAPVDAAKPSALGIKTDIMVLGDDTVTSYQRKKPLSFDKGENYTDVEGILTFAGNNYRNTFAYGTAEVTEEKLTRVWEVPMKAIDGWSGSGWTGMPLLVKWPEGTKQVMGLYDEAKEKENLVEVIYPTLDGNIYFLDLETGEATRKKINIGVPMKGTGSIDPRGYPMLYIGQGINEVNGKAVSVKFRAVSLIDNEVVWSFGGKDPFSYRSWQAYDSSAVIDAETDTLITGGENGVLYTTVLNTEYDEQAGTISIDPEGLIKYRYTMSGYGNDGASGTKRWWGIENSIATWRNYAFFTDNGGLLQCVDLNTMELKYAVDVKDDSDTSIVIEEDIENNTFYLYTANEVDKQEGAAAAGYGKSWHRKINGVTGEIIWEYDWKASVGNSSSNGGTLTTPAIIDDIIVYCMDLVPIEVDNGNGGTKTVNGGRMIAYNKKTGEIVWTYEQKADYWSSPVVVTATSGKQYIVQCDRGGYMKLHDPKTGKVITSVDLGSRVDSTPSAYGNMIVVGTRGMSGSGESQKIIGVKIS